MPVSTWRCGRGVRPPWGPRGERGGRSGSITSQRSSGRRAVVKENCPLLLDVHHPGYELSLAGVLTLLLDRYCLTTVSLAAYRVIRPTGGNMPFISVCYRG